VDDQLGQFRAELRLEAVAERGHALRALGGLLLEQLERLVQRDGGCDRLRARPQARLLKAAEVQRLQLCACAQQQSADAGRPWNLRPLNESDVTPSARKSTGSLPTTCVASVCSGTFAARQSAAISATGCSTPVS
jgi:hypothetical protein